MEEIMDKIGMTIGILLIYGIPIACFIFVVKNIIKVIKNKSKKQILMLIVSIIIFVTIIILYRIVAYNISKSIVMSKSIK